MKTLTRKQIKEGLEQVPMADILGVSRKAITPKMQSFAQEVAKGSTKADAYRKAYKPNASKHTLASKPYELAKDVRIQAEIEAYKLAIEASKHRTPAALRELVIQSLVQVVIDPKAKQSTKVAAAKVLGTVTEVAAFTERKQVHTISSSADTKAQIMGQLREMLKAGAEDATVIEADTLLKELAGETHPSATPQASQAESHLQLHTIPPESPDEDSVLDTPPPENISSAIPTPSFREDTPG
jgi:predicted transcriptional regulator